jgi:hypothetical protein
VSDDEALRRRGPFLVLIPLLVILALGLWLRSRVLEDYRAFQGFCNATHVGETWAHVQERASAKGWGFVRQSKQGLPSEEWLAQVDFWSYRAGCVVIVSKGRVIGTRFAELP